MSPVRAPPPRRVLGRVGEDVVIDVGVSDTGRDETIVEKGGKGYRQYDADEKSEEERSGCESLENEGAAAVGCRTVGIGACEHVLKHAD